MPPPGAAGAKAATEPAKSDAIASFIMSIYDVLIDTIAIGIAWMEHE